MGGKAGARAQKVTCGGVLEDGPVWAGTRERNII